MRRNTLVTLLAVLCPKRLLNVTNGAILVFDEEHYVLTRVSRIVQIISTSEVFFLDSLHLGFSRGANCVVVESARRKTFDLTVIVVVCCVQMGFAFCDAVIAILADGFRKGRHA